MTAFSLGSWAVIDIETTGVTPFDDEIIDVGFLQFDGTTLVKRYSSLVRSELELSQFIQKLTGIQSKQLKKAPRPEEVRTELSDLFGHHLIAHNASFEAGFLTPWFRAEASASDIPHFEDSLPFLGFLFPRISSLGLEGFIKGMGLRTHEVHRGLEDSEDLLKVLLISMEYLERRKQNLELLKSLVLKHQLLESWWMARFLFLNREQRQEIAGHLDFSVEEYLPKAIDWIEQRTQEQSETQFEKSFELGFSSEKIKKIWSDTAQVAAKFPGYRFRQSQEELSLRVGQAFKNNVHALIQAPTGTGKTMGYLLPAALMNLDQAEDKHQVLVATGTKTLQHQAMKKDVPALRKLLGVTERELKIKPLVGSNNHLCELLYRSERDDDLFSPQEDFEAKWTRAYLDHVFVLNAKSSSVDTLTRGDLAFVLKKQFKKLEEEEKTIAVDYRSCTGHQCPFKNDCGYLKGLREAKEADIIIGNHALMFSWTRSFPRPEYIIVDEAHKLEGEVTSAFTMTITSEMLKTLMKTLANQQGLGSLYYLLAQFEESKGSSTLVIQDLREKTLSAQQMMSDHLVGLDEKVEICFKKRPQYTSLYWNEMPMVTAKGKEALSLSLFHHFDSLRHIITNLNQALLPYRGMFEARELDDENQLIAFTRFETFAAQCEDIQIAFEWVLDHPSEREDYAKVMKYHETQGFALEAAPIDIGRVLHDQLLQTSKSCVMTSATLGNAEGDQGVRGIEWATGYTYLDSTRRFKSGFYLPATYDYKNNTRVFLCDDTPALGDSNFVPLVLEKLKPLMSQLHGRSLLLFSARQRFEIAREILLRDFEGKIPVFIQGMGNDVIEEFKASGGGILLGMESFGEGIDIPGEDLQFVFIDKIPDLRHDLVIQKRRDFFESNLGNEFTDYYLSHRTRSLQQKLGRLLRTETDHGAVIVVDSRVRSWKGRSMDTLMKLMEPYQLERATLDQACEKSLEFILYQ